MATLDNALVRIREIEQQAVGHCNCPRSAMQRYGRSLAECTHACESEYVQQAVRNAEQQIIRVHGEWARDALAGG